MESEENEGLELGQRSSHIHVMRSRNFYRRGRKLCLILRYEVFKVHLKKIIII